MLLCGWRCLPRPWLRCCRIADSLRSDRARDQRQDDLVRRIRRRGHRLSSDHRLPAIALRIDTARRLHPAREVGCAFGWTVGPDSLAKVQRTPMFGFMAPPAQRCQILLAVRTEVVGLHDKVHVKNAVISTAPSASVIAHGSKSAGYILPVGRIAPSLRTVGWRTSGAWCAFGLLCQFCGVSWAGLPATLPFR